MELPGRIGAGPTQRPTARHYLISLKFLGTTPARAACWPSIGGIRQATALTAFAIAPQPWRTASLSSEPVAAVPATAQRERLQSLPLPTVVVRDTPSPRGRPDSPASRTTECATSPTFPCLLRTAAPGGTIPCFATPTRKTAERRAPERPATGAAAEALPLPRRSSRGFKLW